MPADFLHIIDTNEFLFPEESLKYEDGEIDYDPNEVVVSFGKKPVPGGKPGS